MAGKRGRTIDDVMPTTKSTATISSNVNPAVWAMRPTAGFKNLNFFRGAD